MAGLTRRWTALVMAAGCCLARPGLAAERIRIRDLYARGAEFSPQALALADKTVTVPGFMAPPLKPDASFFVLTKLPMAVCPFCDSELNWPNDIVLVRLAGQQDWVDFNQPILVTGTLSLGTEIDEETGFVSRVRLVDASYELA
ncbi:MAG TPA: hypothetical protein VHL31_14910 [Geminicoccus sp.]|jgi:hypothetical protein|uniref:hypothetical protein n=1 Tax=Geminicoccus sp. TaxID=2024832 RepID=UPI002E373E3D|nr:hypothetical protein [Geminicoccus sp.]HEX2527572.1 hypothetical protein [Geminicoccus sp.]